MSDVPAHRAASVEFDHVTKSYDSRATKAGAPGAVNDLSLEIPAGKICVLVGPSGCGKTTSLKMVNRLIEPTSGRILLDGVDAATRDTTELRAGHRLRHPADRPVPAPDDRGQRRHGAAPAGLAEGAACARAPTSCWPSSGSTRPVRPTATRPSSRAASGSGSGVARALAADPPVMLMDEPFGAVDPIVRDRLQNEFLRLQEQLAKTILFVTHDIDEAIKMGDLVVVFQAGGVVAQFGPPAEILASPASEFVARFVGTDRGLKRLIAVPGRRARARAGRHGASSAATARSPAGAAADDTFGTS